MSKVERKNLLKKIERRISEKLPLVSKYGGIIGASLLGGAMLFSLTGEAQAAGQTSNNRGNSNPDSALITPNPESVESTSKISLPGSGENIRQQTGPELGEPLTGVVNPGVNIRREDGSVYTNGEDQARIVTIIGSVNTGEPGSSTNEVLATIDSGAWYEVLLNGEILFVAQRLVEVPETGISASETEPAPNDTPPVVEPVAVPEPSSTGEAEINIEENPFITEAAYQALYPPGTFDHLNLGTAPVVFDETVGAYRDTTSGEFYFPGLGVDAENDRVEGWATLGGVLESSDFEPGLSGLRIIILNAEGSNLGVVDYMNQELMDQMITGILSKFGPDESSRPDLTGKVIRVVYVPYNQQIFSDDHERPESFALRKFYKDVLAESFVMDNSGNITVGLSINPNPESGGWGNDTSLAATSALFLGLNSTSRYRSGEVIDVEDSLLFMGPARDDLDENGPIIGPLFNNMREKYAATGSFLELYPIATINPN